MKKVSEILEGLQNVREGTISASDMKNGFDADIDYPKFIEDVKNKAGGDINLFFKKFYNIENMYGAPFYEFYGKLEDMNDKEGLAMASQGSKEVEKSIKTFLKDYKKGATNTPKGSKLSKGKYDQKEVDILLKLTEALNLELDTKKYTMTKEQRNVVYTLSNGYHNAEKIIDGYKKTLEEGLFNPSFNSQSTADEFMQAIDSVLGKGKFEFRHQIFNDGKSVMIPGFSFGGFPVYGKMGGTGLFKK